MVSDMSKGLFHKAIAMSGTVYSPWAVSSVKDWTQRLSRKLGWNGDGGDKACLAILQNASADSITKAQESILTLEVCGYHLIELSCELCKQHRDSFCRIASDMCSSLSDPSLNHTKANNVSYQKTQNCLWRMHGRKTYRSSLEAARMKDCCSTKVSSDCALPK